MHDDISDHPVADSYHFVLAVDSHRGPHDMGLKELLDKGKCLIGLHKGEWKAPSPSSCAYERVCERCAARHSKTEHLFAPWTFISADACDETRACSRCGNTESRITHAWAAAEYIRDDFCEQHQRCSRCQGTKPAGVTHNMNQWRFLDVDSCAQLQYCGRCNTDGAARRSEHQWGEWQHSNAHNGPVRVCKRCGELEARPQPVVAVAGLAPPNVTDRDVADLLSRAQGSAALERDEQLIGHWRHTEARGGSGFSMATDYHMVLEAAGRFARWSHTVSGLGENRSETQPGAWEASSGVLRLHYDDGDNASFEYQVRATDLLLPNASLKYWERVR